MKRELLIILILTLNSIIILNAQSSNELERRKGFKGIVLGSQVEEYSDLVYKKEYKDKNIPDSRIYSRKSNTYTDIGGIKILDLEVKVYRGTIYEIKVITKNDSKFAESLKKAFGSPNYSVRSGMYTWGSPSVSLSMISKGKSRFELIYLWTGIKQLVQKDRQAEINQISEDF